MKRSIVTVLLFIFFIPVIRAQVIDSVIARYADQFPQERSYIHYDKSTYAPGETIWFKAYLMSGVSPADDSKNFYVDWTDDKGNLLAHNVHPIVEGTTNGQFELPAGYSGDHVHVKAYTKWMLNFDSSFLYNKDIRVIYKKPATATPKLVIIPQLQFFPEGGDAVNGITNKIAFKANDQWGRPVKIKGIIVDDKGKKIDSIRVLHDGMGYITIQPVEGQSYAAKWKDPAGKDYSTPLPAARSTGVGLQVVINGDKRFLTVNVPTARAAAIGNITLIGTMNQHQAFKVTRDISSGSVKVTIPTQDLPSGVLVVTAFDEQLNPLAERISFIKNEQDLFASTIEVKRWGLSKRARNEVEITIPDSLVANLSVAVTDADIDSDSSNTIVSHLLLTSEIKGQVFNPSYYFSSTADSVTQHLDLVMLTHGWRRFNWEEMVKAKYPKIIYPRDTSYLVMSGKVYGATPSQLRDAGDIVLFVKPKKGDGQTLMVPVNPNGWFEEPELVIFDSVHVYYQLSKKKGLGDASVQFMPNLLPPFKYNTAATGLFNNQRIDTSGNFRHLAWAEEAARLIKQAEGQVLGNVTVKAKTKTPVQILDEKYTSGLFTSGDSYQFDLVNDPLASAATNIFQYLQGKVAGLQISTSGQDASMTWRGGTPQLFLDEIQTDVSMVSSVSVADIAYIKVMRPPFFGGGTSGNGAIAIYTRRGDDAKSVPGKGLSNNLVRGYTEIRQFYSPNYASFKQENEKKDIRTTVYWNPQVKTTAQNNKATIVFYNNDISRAFRVIIEGMSQSGRLTRLEEIME